MSALTPTDDNSRPQISSKHTNISGGIFANAEKGSTIIVNDANINAQMLERLQAHSSPDALHTSAAVSRQDLCTPGTRTFTLSRLQSLATSSEAGSPDVIWMHGPAGAGKSAIMRTLANTLDAQGVLLASFFFFRSESARNTSRPFIPTLASQLCAFLPSTQPHISQAVQRGQHLSSHSARHQSSHLLEKPLTSVLPATGTPLAIIVDGLDECTDEGGQAEIIDAMVHLASAIRAGGKQRVKIFIVSRPEYEIQSTFDKLKSDSSVATVRLNSKDANIHLFYDEQFDRIRKKFTLPSSWPSNEEIKWLTKKTSGQYSFAGVSTRLMYNGDPVKRLALMQERLKDDTLQPFEALDQLYATVFSQVPDDMRTQALLILRCRLHPPWSLAWEDIVEPLLQLPRNYIQSLRPYLSSLVDFDEDMEPYHASLGDFLVDPSRSGKFGLHIDERTLSHTLQEGMLAHLTSEREPPKTLRDNEEYTLYIFLIQGALDNVMEDHPLPSARLSSALQRIVPSSLTIMSSLNLVLFLKSLERQFRIQYHYAKHPVLWYTIRYALPRLIRLEWERRTQLYYVKGVDQAKADFLIGCVLIREQSFLHHADKEVLAVDSPAGWNLLVPRDPTGPLVLRYHLQRSSGMFYHGRYVHAMLQFASEEFSCPTQEHTHKVMSDPKFAFLTLSSRVLSIEQMQLRFP